MVKNLNKTIFSLLLLLSIYPSIGLATSEIWNEIYMIERAIENLGTKVYWSKRHKVCQEGILGAYIPKLDVIYICQENHEEDLIELLGTLKHEGWHAVQKKCNNDLALLTDAQMRSHLKIRDRKNLHSYHPTNERAEAEARVIEQIPTIPWIKGVKKLCFQ